MPMYDCHHTCSKVKGFLLRGFAVCLHYYYSDQVMETGEADAFSSSTMASDMIWRVEPEYGQVFTVAALTVFQAIFIAIIVSYLRSKPTATKTVLDSVNIVFLSWLMVAGLSKASQCILINLWSDCGHMVAIIATGLDYTIVQIAILVTLAVVTIQFCIVMRPWLLESAAFEQAVKIVVIWTIPALSIIITATLLASGSDPPMAYYLLRNKEVTLTSSLQTNPALALRIVIILVSFLSSLVMQIWIKISGRQVSGQQSSNNVVRFRDLGLSFTVYFILLFLSLELKLFQIRLVTNFTLLFYVALRACSHTSVISYIQNRPALRALVNAYAVREARSVMPMEIQNAAA